MPSKSKTISEEQRHAVATQIIEAIKNNPDGHWSKPWDASLFAPRNPCTKNTYRGINAMWLSLFAEVRDYNDPRWVTFNEAKVRGWHVKKGATAAYVEKWGPVLYRVDPETKKPSFVSWEKTKPFDREKMLMDGWDRIFSLQRVFPVFNASQIEGIPELIIPSPKGREEQYQIADRYIELSPCKVEERYSTTSAFYAPGSDRICLPSREAFKSGNDFLATLWHEMSHSTGHSSRLNRALTGVMSDETYAREELNAELSSMFIQAAMGIDSFGGTTFENNIEYLRNWASAIDIDSDSEREKAEKLVLDSVSCAGGIADYITSPYFEKYPRVDLDPNIKQTEIKDREISKQQNDFVASIPISTAKPKRKEQPVR